MPILSIERACPGEPLMSSDQGDTEGTEGSFSQGGFSSVSGLGSEGSVLILQEPSSHIGSYVDGRARKRGVRRSLCLVDLRAKRGVTCPSNSTYS